MFLARGTTFISAICLLPALAQAQGLSNPIGQTLKPTGNVVIYSTPENGLISRQRAKTLVAPSDGAVTLYPLKREGSEYVTGTPSQAEGLTVKGVREVVQGRSTNTWLKVDNGEGSGWIKYDPSVTGTLPSATE